ncbi:MAG: rod shape-determining protein [Desulfovibrio sp.]|uniref:rod shape-determining protein n=1 Tax=Desulfovibrio sp. TaxID=885 RepID=UPI001A6FB87A|nr:rod shape-determining protein [Desulfovibrio sp.]MBD5417737.1 rod shape-determining protein [Desulfovibrio sp.]
MFPRRFLRLFATDIAMDLGTANTLLATKKHGIVVNEPSVVALDARTGAVLAVGTQARGYVGRTPAAIRAVRPMQNGVIADFDVTRAMISHFVRKAIDGWRLVRPSMVICVPSGVTQVEKRAVIDAAQLAGAEDISLIEEPMAAALGADLPIREPVGNMVLDIGGGTSEVAVISLGGVAAAQSVRVAGDAMTHAVQRYLREVFRMEVGENTAENVKILLGSAWPQPDAPVLEVSGKDLVQGRPRAVTVSEGHIREALAEPLQAVRDTVLRALEATPPELAADVSRNGLLLAGGGALLKGLDQYLARETRLRVFVDTDPLTTVLRGTARAMADRKGFASVFIN